MAKTRGVFALINDGTNLLLSERMDGKGWNLPGGRVEEGETDHVALAREVKEETGLDVEVLRQLGPDHVFNEDTAVAYFCRVIGDELKTTEEAKCHWFASSQEVKQGWFARATEAIEGENVAYDPPVTLKLVGPEGRLGRTGRMVWDFFSIMESPQISPLDHAPRGSLVYQLSDDNTQFVSDDGERELRFNRFDPYSPTGNMQTK